MFKSMKLKVICAVTLLICIAIAFPASAAESRDEACSGEAYQEDGPIKLKGRVVGYFGSTPYPTDDYCTGVFDVYGRGRWTARVPEEGTIGTILVVQDTILHIVAWRQNGRIQYAWGILGSFRNYAAQLYG